MRVVVAPLKHNLHSTSRVAGANCKSKGYLNNRHRIETSRSVVPLSPVTLLDGHGDHSCRANVGTSFPGGWRKRMLNAGATLADRAASIGSAKSTGGAAVGRTRIVLTPGHRGHPVIMEKGGPIVRLSKEKSCASTCEVLLHASLNATIC